MRLLKAQLRAWLSVCSVNRDCRCSGPERPPLPPAPRPGCGLLWGARWGTVRNTAPAPGTMRRSRQGWGVLVPASVRPQASSGGQETTFARRLCPGRAARPAGQKRTGRSGRELQVPRLQGPEQVSLTPEAAHSTPSSLARAVPLIPGRGHGPLPRWEVEGRRWGLRAGKRGMGSGQVAGTGPSRVAAPAPSSHPGGFSGYLPGLREFRGGPSDAGAGAGPPGGSPPLWAQPSGGET